MRVINLTAHDVNICDDNGCIIKTYKPSGIEARVRNNLEVVGYIDGIEVSARTNFRTEGLLEPAFDTVYIVSDIVRNRHSDRMDLVSPGDKVKMNGIVIGCKSFVCN